MDIDIQQITITSDCYIPYIEALDLPYK